MNIKFDLTYRKNFGKKNLRFLIALVAAVILNFIVPRLMPADPVFAITGKMAFGMAVILLVMFAVKRKAALPRRSGKDLRRGAQLSLFAGG